MAPMVAPACTGAPRRGATEVRAENETAAARTEPGEMSLEVMEVSVEQAAARMPATFLLFGLPDALAPELAIEARAPGRFSPTPWPASDAGCCTDRTDDGALWHGCDRGTAAPSVRLPYGEIWEYSLVCKVKAVLSCIVCKSTVTQL